MVTFDAATIAPMIDHTLLKSTATEEQYRQLCRDAASYGFGQVCLPSCYVPLAVQEIKALGKFRSHGNGQGNALGQTIGIATVVGFPLGYQSSKAKAFETLEALKEGAQEIDLVINLSHLQSIKFDLILQELTMINQICLEHHGMLKVIIESYYLTKVQIEDMVEIVIQSGAAFIKTSTGFATPQQCPVFENRSLPHTGATLEVVDWMKQKIDHRPLLIKASGGIKTWEDCCEFAKRGAQRLGTSQAVDFWPWKNNL